MQNQSEIKLRESKVMIEFIDCNKIIQQPLELKLEDLDLNCKVIFTKIKSIFTDEKVKDLKELDKILTEIDLLIGEFKSHSLI